VDLKAGPDGALYVADFYERRISHVDPRDTWDRTTGRIFRVRPAEWKPGLKPFDLGSSSGAELVQKLESRNRWERTMTREMLALHPDRSVVPELRKMLTDDSQTGLEALWAINAIGALDADASVVAMQSGYAPERAWAVRLQGDTKDKPIAAFDYLLKLEERERDPQVRSQLASTAKRLPASQSLPLIKKMLARDADAGDVHIPLLIWWAVEDKAASHRDETVEALSDPGLWSHAMARDVVLPRLARRYAADPTPENQAALARFLRSAPNDADRGVLLAGVKEGFSGLPLREIVPSLRTILIAGGDAEISLRLGEPSALEPALAMVKNESKDAQQRVRTIETLAQLGNPSAVPALLDVAKNAKSQSVRKAAISALGRFDNPSIGAELVAVYPRLSSGSDLRTSILSTLLGRPAWTAELLRAIDRGQIPRADLGITQIERAREFTDPGISVLADKLFGKQSKPTSEEHAREVARVTRLVTTGAGDARAGRELFTTRCAVCHTLYGQGAKVGPDLTGYERRNVDFLVLSVVDPSAYIREEYTAFRVRTKGGETLIGLITERGANQITLEDAAQQKTAIPKDQIAEERALPTSLMPEGLLEGLSDQQVRDLFKYLSSEKPPG
jgi:putative heme-binding domain-containing protein